MTAAAPQAAPWYPVANAADIASPTVLIYPDRIAANLRRMIDWVGGDPSRLRPHVKTHKLPQVVAMKLAAGITKFKASTIAEVEMVAAAGGRDIVLAYQPVGPNVNRLIRLIGAYRAATFAALADDPHVVQTIGRAATDAGVVVRLYVDLNVGMDRTGIMPGDAAFDLYRLLCDTAGVEAAGLHAYDGHLTDADYERLVKRSSATFGPVWQLRDRLRSAGLAVPGLIASGTPTSKVIAAQNGTEVSAGTTVLWDAGQAKICPDLQFEHAALLLTRVISRPAADRLCLDLGHKAVASEFDPPRVVLLGLEDAVPVTHSEEHLVIQTDRATAYPPGTVVYGVPHHVCPTMALHQSAWCVRDGRAVETWDITARNRCLTI